MSNDNDKKKSNGMEILAIFIIFGFICGVLTNLLIIIPIKHVIWSKLPKDERRSWFQSMTPYGEGIISMRGILTCLYYGAFWVFFAIIAANIWQRGFSDFVNITGVMIMFSVFMLTFLGTSIWVAHHDITNTDYGNGNKDCQRRRAEDAENARIRKIAHEKWCAESDAKFEANMADFEESGKFIEELDKKCKENAEKEKENLNKENQEIKLPPLMPLK